MNKCLICGKETKNKKYCSIECKSKAMSKPKGYCLNCGELLTRCGVKYCSNKCYREYKHKKFEESIVYNKCIICGKDTRNEKYCSMECMGKDTSRHKIAIENLKNSHIWSQEEIDFLKKNYGEIPLSNIEKQLNIKKENIIAYASKHNIASKRQWKISDEQYLLKNNDKNIDEISTKLNKSKASIVAKYRRLNGFENEYGKSIISPQDYILKFMQNELNLKCLNEIPIGKFRTDILINNLDIEIQGTYWHGDKRLIDNLTDKQIKCIEKDKRKKDYFASLGIEIYYIWEYDLYSNPQKCKENLKNKLKQLGIT